MQYVDYWKALYIKGLSFSTGMVGYIVKENMEFCKYPLNGFHAVVILIVQIIPWVMYLRKWLSPKNSFPP